MPETEKVVKNTGFILWTLVAIAILIVGSFFTYFIYLILFGG